MAQLKSIVAASCLFAVVAAVPTGNAKVVDLPISNIGSYKSVSFSVGSPPKTFKLEFDTGSSATFLTSSSCTPDFCPYYPTYPRNTYNISQSSTGKYTGVNTEDSYTGGGIAGPVATDLFHAGGLGTWNQTFVDTTYNSFSNNIVDGFVGLAFPAITPYGTETMFQDMGQQGILAEPKFGIYYGDVNSNSTNQGGILTLGGTREHKYVKGSIAEIPIVKTDYEGVAYEVWKANFTTIKGSGSKTDINMPNSLITFDSGTSQILIASNYINALYESLGLGWDYTLISQNKQALYCSEFNSSWSVTFGFGPKGDRKVTLYGDELALPGFPIAPGACFPPFTDSGANDTSIFGNFGLGPLYSTWDFGSFNETEFKPTLRLGRVNNRKRVGSQ